MASQLMDQQWRSNQSVPQRPPPPLSPFAMDKGIDDWQKKIDDDFNQIYYNLYQEYEKNPSTFQGLKPLMPPPTGMGMGPGMTVPDVIITDVKDTSKIEKIDHINRIVQTFDDFPNDGGKI
jgi:hypothetical protein